jgi:hypothetical protein
MKSRKQDIEDQLNMYKINHKITTIKIYKQSNHGRLFLVVVSVVMICLFIILAFKEI